MKKLFMATIVLTSFAIALSIIQMSCSKTTAQNSQTTLTQLNKLIYLKYASGAPSYIYTSNYDGTNEMQVPIALTPTMEISYGANSFTVTFSPDGQKIFFLATDSTIPTITPSIYSCNIDGSNVQLVKSSNTEVIKFGGAH